MLSTVEIYAAFYITSCFEKLSLPNMECESAKTQFDILDNKLVLVIRL